MTNRLLSIAAAALTTLAIAAPAAAESAPGEASVAALADDVDPAYLDELIAQADRRDLHLSRQWLLLGHYHPELLGGWESYVDHPDFFLGDGGKHDPRAELRGTLRAFFEAPYDGPHPEDAQEALKLEHPQCTFRARYRFLRKVMQFDAERLPERDCVEYDEWRDILGARSVTLIFASAYMNNPASMFGHTFLRLDRDYHGRGSPLISYAVNYAAEPWSNFPPIYIAMGLTGGFKGTFTTIPYYLKLLQYTDMENRDLWEYRLGLDQDQVDQMVAHLWEVGRFHIDYWYFDENCSFHLLSLLEVADPSLHLTDGFGLWAIPSDTLRATLEASGLVVERTFRPSQHAVMLARRSVLNEAEIEAATRIGAGDEPAPFAALAGFDEARQAAILDAALQYLRYRTEKQPEGDDKKLEHAILKHRGALGIASAEAAVVDPPAPESGHATAMVAAGGGASNRGGGHLDLVVRPALHDTAAPQSGYVNHSQIEFFATRLRLLPDDERLILEEMDFLHIVSLAPLDRWVRKWSWWLKTGLYRTRGGDCDGYGCLHWAFQGGPGTAVGLDAANQTIVYGFLNAEAAAGEAFDDGYRLSAGPAAGVLWQVAAPVRLRLEAGYRYPFLGVDRPGALPGDADGPLYELTSEVSVRLSRDAELRLTGTARRAWREAGLMVVGYF